MQYGKVFVLVVASAVGPTISAEHLEEVVVHGSHEKRTIDVVDEMTIAADTAQLLKKAPGANVNGNGPLSGIPQYRGMYGPRVGVQLNGTQLAPAGPNWMDPPLSYAAAAQLESLELYRGIAPVSVVQESIGGAINAVSKRGNFASSRKVDLSTHLVALAQSVNSGRQLGATVLAANDQHRLRLAAMTEQADDADFPSGVVLPSEYARDRYDIAYGFRSGEHTIELEYVRSETGHSGTAALPMDIDYIDGDMYSLGYTFEGAQWSLDARFFASDLDHGMTNYHLRLAPASQGMWRRNITDSANRGFKFAATFRDDKGSWLVGTDGLDSVHNSDIDNPNNPAFFVVNFNDAERRVLGAFLERQQNFNEAWSAELGLRYNRVEMDAGEVDGTPVMMPPGMMLRERFNDADRRQTDDNLDGVAKLFYRVTDSTRYYLGLAQKNRSPAYQERYLWLPLQATGGLADGFTYTGNIDLKPERGREIELGLDFSGAGLVLSPRLFYRNVENYIQGTASAIPAATMFVNMMNMSSGSLNPAPLQFNNVEATLWGFDMDWRYELSANWSLGGLVNYVRGERDDVDDNLYRIAPLNASAKLAYRSSDWGASAETVFYDKQDKVSATNQEQETESYGLLNLSAYWQANSGLRLVVGMDNALDEDYAEHTGGTNRVMGNPDIAPGVKLPGYGRNVYARVDLNF
jgi:iron complex outermembrane recepter protein